MANVEIYTKDWCGFSARAKDHLDGKGVAYSEIDVTSDVTKEREMISRSGRYTVPQVFVHGHHVGGSDDLVAADDSGLLDRLLSETSEGEAA